MINFLNFKYKITILPTEYLWLESYLSNDSLWLEDVLNWEDVFDLTFQEFSFYSFFFSSFFLNTHIFMDFFSKISFFDILFFSHFNKLTFSREFFDYFIWDITFFINNNFLPLQFFFYSDYQDFIAITLYYSPELILALQEYFFFIETTQF